MEEKIDMNWYPNRHGTTINTLGLHLITKRLGLSSAEQMNKINKCTNLWNVIYPGVVGRGRLRVRANTLRNVFLFQLLGWSADGVFVSSAPFLRAVLSRPLLRVAVVVWFESFERAYLRVADTVVVMVCSRATTSRTVSSILTQLEVMGGSDGWW